MRLTLREIEKFTEKELDLILLSIIGYDDVEISKDLNLNIDDVGYYIDNSVKKLNAKNREDAKDLMLYVIKHNMVESLLEN